MIDKADLEAGNIYSVEYFPGEYDLYEWSGSFFRIIEMQVDRGSIAYEDAIDIEPASADVIDITPVNTDTPPAMDKAVKYDTDKLRMELIPSEMMTALASVLTFGAQKYSDRNWEKGMKWSRCYGALMRHMLAWWSGEDKDIETGRSHLWHAACCISFLVTYEARGVGEDDREGK